MNAETLIISGLLLVLSGAVWLWIDSSKSETGKQPSLTEAFKANYRRIQVNYFFAGLGLISLSAGVYIWWVSEKNLLWTWLWIATCAWFLKMRRSISMTGLLFLGGAALYYFNFQLGLVWLLTAIGIGYFDYNSQREKQNIFTQISVVLNPVGSLGIFLNNLIKKGQIEQVGELKMSRIQAENLYDCPVCKTGMEFFKTQDGGEKVVFDKCPKCGAVWFDEIEHLWVIKKINNPAKSQNFKGPPICPRCNIKMGYKKQEKVYICAKCRGNLSL